MKFMVVLLTVLAWAGLLFGQDVRILPSEERLAWPGATHEVVLTHAALTTATTNTAQVFNVPVLAKQSFAVVATVLETPFVSATTNANNTLALTIGDGSTANVFLASQELCSDGTEVYLKHGADWFDGGRAVYTANGNAVFTVTPHASYGVADMGAGRVRILVQIMDAVNRLR